MFLFRARKNICTAPYPDAQELLSWKQVSVYFCIPLLEIFVPKSQDFI